MKTDLEKYIDENFGSNKSAFARYMQVNSQQITKWVRDNWIVYENKIYAPRREIPNFVKVVNAFSSTKKFPLYVWEEFDAHKCYLTLDIKSGNIDIHLGYDCPPDVFHKRVLRFPINPYLTNKEVQKCIQNHLPTFQSILTGSKIVYNESDWVGEFNKDATESIERLEISLSNIDAEQSYISDNFDLYLERDPFGIKYNARNIDEVVLHILKEAAKNADNLSDELTACPHQAVKDYYNYLLQNLENFKDVPSWIKDDVEFSYLLDDE
jgi:hypothetical protein